MEGGAEWIRGVDGIKFQTVNRVWSRCCLVARNQCHLARVVVWLDESGGGTPIATNGTVDTNDGYL